MAAPPQVEYVALVDGADRLDLAPSDRYRLQLFDLGDPATRQVSDVLPGRDGTRDETGLHGGRAVALRFVVLDRADMSAAQAVEQLGRFRHPSKRPVLQWRLKGQEDRQAIVTPDQTVRPMEAARQFAIAVQAGFRIADGLLHAQAEQTAIANPADFGKGRIYPLIYDRVYPKSAGKGEMTVTHQGTGMAPPILRVYGPCSGPKVTNETVGATLRFNDSLAISSRSYMEVDTAARTIRLNGSDDLGDNLRPFLDFAGSDWWRLAPGPNIIRFHPTTHSSPSQLHVIWHDAYL